MAEDESVEVTAGADVVPIRQWLVTSVDLTGTFVLSVHGASVAAAAGSTCLAWWSSR
jgi:hypothetical protein